MLFLDGAYVDNEHESAARSKMTAMGNPADQEISRIDGFGLSSAH
jgi:hypothetical protein